MRLAVRNGLNFITCLAGHRHDDDDDEKISASATKRGEQCYYYCNRKSRSFVCCNVIASVDLSSIISPDRSPFLYCHRTENGGSWRAMEDEIEMARAYKATAAISYTNFRFSCSLTERGQKFVMIFFFVIFRRTFVL